MDTARRCTSCGAGLASDGETPGICVACAFVLALNRAGDLEPIGDGKSRAEQDDS